MPATVVGLIVAALALAACTPPGLPAPIAPSGQSSAPSSPPGIGTIVIGLDGTSGPIGGFNPHAIADFSPASQAVSSLVLPSTFVTAADGRRVPDPDVVDAATVTSQQPFTVTYTIDRKASWSDGTPITADDFSYLRDQLLVQPATVDPAGYRLISAIRSRNAGKTVDVEFATPFPDWPTLFSSLLPSHIMKDFPGGWAAALNADIPVSGNRYKMSSYDPVTGQILLARNDKYWGTPPGPATVVLRLGDPSDLIGAFSRGDVQALWLEPGAKTLAEFDASVPAGRRTIVPVPASVQLIFNSTSGPTASVDVRAAIAAGISPSVVAKQLSGGWGAGAATVTSQVRLPAQLSPAETGAAGVVTSDPVIAARRLTAAGYLKNGLYATKDGEVLRLTLGYPSGDRPLAAAARTIQRQLGLVGIEVDLLADTPSSLLETRAAAGTLDLTLTSLPRGPADAVASASAFGCPRPGTSTAGGEPVDPLVPGSTAEAAAPTPTTGVTTGDVAAAGRVEPGGSAAPGDGTVPLRTGNLSGYCAPETQALLAQAISGRGSAQAADPRLWTDLPVLPIAQLSTVFALSPALSSVLHGGHEEWLWTGPLQGLPGWPAP